MQDLSRFLQSAGIQLDDGYESALLQGVSILKKFPSEGHIYISIFFPQAQQRTVLDLFFFIFHGFIFQRAHNHMTPS